MPLMHELTGHECAHVISLGWAGTKNGQLLEKAVASGFDVLLTYDAGIPSQNDISSKAIAVFLLKPKAQGMEGTRVLLGDVLEALDTCEPGQVRIVTNRNES